mmetsp:Transcript_21668/g.33088  ORF Transcript_21668/g.33088 Transcript_21668/m.33088 type:complete len:90 (+) Transcript_21668:216-485(+)
MVEPRFDFIVWNIAVHLEFCLCESKVYANYNNHTQHKVTSRMQIEPSRSVLYLRHCSVVGDSDSYIRVPKLVSAKNSGSRLSSFPVLKL